MDIAAAIRWRQGQRQSAASSAPEGLAAYQTLKSIYRVGPAN